MSDSNNKKERRKSKRIQAKNLPVTFQTLHLSFADGPKLTVKTFDASDSGISVDVPMPVYSITEFNVTLNALDSSFEIEDEVVYIKPINKQSSRVSIRFSDKESLGKYMEMLEQAKQNYNI